MLPEPHPDTQFVPPLTDEEYAALKAMIEKKGRIINPVVVDEDGLILDGVHRVKIARELGWTEVPLSVEGPLSDEERLTIVIGMNTRRRQFDRAKRRETARRLQAEGFSRRKIAGMTGWSKSQVQRDLQDEDPAQSNASEADKLKVEMVPLDELKPFPGNPRRGNVEALMEAIQHFGFQGVITATRDGTIISGNHRYEAMRRLGEEKIPVVRFENALEKARLRQLLASDTSVADLDERIKERMALVEDQMAQAQIERRAEDLPEEKRAQAALKEAIQDRELLARATGEPSLF